MSFFGIDDRDKKSVSSFALASNPDSGLSGNLDNEDEHAIHFEDIYDGLGDQLEESGDDFNDDTFGGERSNEINSNTVGNDYDFFGRTARVSEVISEEQAQFNGQKLTTKPDSDQRYTQSLSKSNRSNNERFQQPDHVPEMLVDASIWGVTPKRAASIPAAGTPVISNSAPDRRKMMSVEELEASMLNQSKNLSSDRGLVQIPSQEPFQKSQSTAPHQSFQYYSLHPQDMLYEASRQHLIHERTNTVLPNKTSENLKQAHQVMGQGLNNLASPKVFILQNPNRSSHEHKNHVLQNPGFYKYQTGPHHITNSYQIARLSVEEQAALRIDEAKREKRNRKIFLLSKGNGLMTPQDKNFINRIQLQQLVTATGNPNDHESDLNFTEDFYYQVHHQIHGGSREDTGNTYLYQTVERNEGTRKQFRGFSSHLQQMEQQVQRAVEATKNRTKSKQSVIEGTLGKMSYSSAKTPKPLLNIRSTESRTDSKTAGLTRDRKTTPSSISGSDRKTVLADIERVYSTLMQMEDHDRKTPRPSVDSNVMKNIINLQNEWQEKAKQLNSQLWRHLKVHEPIGATTTHPFIAFLSYGKGMKTVPRVFRHISLEQRTTVLTMIILHLDQLDLVRQGVPSAEKIQLSAETREKIELFSQSVMPPLFGHLNETGLDIVTGILGLLLTINIDLIARTKIGVTILTMILSRAEIIKQAGTANDKQEWDLWVSTYNGFFDILEPTFPDIFPGSTDTDEDVYVWQFLAAIGIGASPKQQQRLVMAVKDRVMETVSLAKSLPPTSSSQRLSNVNLFMRSIGLDVELLA